MSLEKLVLPVAFGDDLVQPVEFADEVVVPVDFTVTVNCEQV